MGNEASIPYDAQLTWSKIGGGSSQAPVPAGREGQVGVCWRNSLYVFGGGSSGGTQQRDLWSLDLDSAKWTDSTTADATNGPSARTGACAAVVDGRMWVFGGLDMERGFLNDLYCFSIAEGAWEQVHATGNGPTPRDKSAVCVHGKKLYFFGGFGPVEAEVEFDAMPKKGDALDKALGAQEENENESEDEEEQDEGPSMSFSWFNDLFSFDTETKEWKQIGATGQIPSPRAAFGMDTVGSSIYLFGGRDQNKRQNDLYVLDTTTTSWSKPTTFGIKPAERSFHTFTSLAPAGKQQLLLFGGLSSREELLNDVHIFDVASFAWVQPATNGEINPRRFHSAALHQRSLVVFGGSSNYSQETQECTTFHNDAFSVDLGPVLDARPVTVPPPTAPMAVAPPAPAFLSSSTKSDQQSDDTRGKKRKSDDITSLGDTPKEPAKEKSNDS